MPTPKAYYIGKNGKLLRLIVHLHIGFVDISIYPAVCPEKICCQQVCWLLNVNWSTPDNLLPDAAFRLKRWCIGTARQRYDDHSVSRRSNGATLMLNDSESHHIQCTAHPPVKRTGNLDHLGSSDISRYPRLKQDCRHRNNRIRTQNWIYSQWFQSFAYQSCSWVLITPIWCLLKNSERVVCVHHY